MSSRMAAMDGESIQVTRAVAIPISEIELRFSRSSGPGGQHAQKTETRVEAVFDVQASEALSEAQKARVIRKAGPVLRAVAQDERSQARNRELAIERLADALREALKGEGRRRPKKPRGGARSSPGNPTRARPRWARRPGPSAGDSRASPCARRAARSPRGRAQARSRPPADALPSRRSPSSPGRRAPTRGVHWARRRGGGC